MQAQLAQSLLKNAKTFSVNVSDKNIKHCPDILLNIAEWFPILGLKMDFVYGNDRKPVKRRMEAYTLVATDDVSADKSAGHSPETFRLYAYTEKTRLVSLPQMRFLPVFVAAHFHNAADGPLKSKSMFARWAEFLRRYCSRHK